MPYRMPTYKVLELLQVDPECGVRSQEIDARRAQYGANEFEEEKKESVSYRKDSASVVEPVTSAMAVTI